MWIFHCLIVAAYLTGQASGWTSTSFKCASPKSSLTLQATAATSSGWFTPSSPPLSSSSSSRAADGTILQKKARILQLGAALDRGQAYNPTSGAYYEQTMQIATDLIQSFCDAHGTPPKAMDEMKGEWELILSTVPHGIFRSSPFFLAIQEAYEEYAANKMFNEDISKADLFFKLHELQTCSWGVSKVGRVAQIITSDTLYSTFDTSIFSLTVIPIIGWFKLLPTFGGCVVTAAKASLQPGEEGLLNMTVDYTTSRPVPGLQGLGSWIWKIKVPVGAIWKRLPWNKGRDAVCRVFVRHVDEDFRIVQDVTGDFFVYTRPVVPRPLDLAEEELN